MKIENKENYERELNRSLTNIIINNDEIIELYELYRSTFPHPELDLAFKYFLTELENLKFKEMKSVNSKFEVVLKSGEGPGRPEETNNYEKLKDVSLYDHTVRIFKNACEEFSSNLNTPPKVGETIVLLCLLHDYGKANRVAYAFCENDQPHNETSAKYAKDRLILLGYKEGFCNLVYNIIFNHHVKKVLQSGNRPPLIIQPPEDMYTKSLNYFDTLTRTQEIAMIMQEKLNKSRGNILEIFNLPDREAK